MLLIYCADVGLELIVLESKGSGPVVRSRLTGRFATKSSQQKPLAPDQVEPIPEKQLSRIQLDRIASDIGSSVVTDTEKEYVRRFNDWIEYAQQTEFDPYMRGYSKTGRVNYVCLYLSSLFRNRSSSRLANTVVQALRFELDKHLLDSSFLDSDSIKRLREAIARVGPRAVGRTRLPVTWDLVQWIKLKYYQRGIDGKMVYIAIALAFNFMLRSSEFIYKKAPETNRCHEQLVHAIRRDNVVCYDRTDKVVTLTPNTPRNVVHRVAFLICTSKTDQLGRGRHVQIVGDGPLQSQLICDVVEFLLESGTQVGRGDFLMSRYKTHRVGSQPKNLKLTRKAVARALKEAATAHGLDSICFSIHGLRIGGATTMAAGNEDEGLIERVGGWDKDSRKAAGYRRGTSLDHGALGTLDTVSNSKIVTSKHTKRLAR